MKRWFVWYVSFLNFLPFVNLSLVPNLQEAANTAFICIPAQIPGLASGVELRCTGTERRPAALAAAAAAESNYKTV